jgi:antirestriction factor ArdC-like protein
MAKPADHLDWRKLLEEALTAPGDLGRVYTRFHDYSLTNMMLFRIQGLREPVASYQTWKSVGRQVVRGARAKEVIVPQFAKEAPPEPKEGESLDEQRERVARLVGFKVVNAVFGLSDTEGPELPPLAAPGWDTAQAERKLGVKQVPFTSADGNLQGYSIGLEYAINPVAVNPEKTRFHEWGHMILGHTTAGPRGQRVPHRGIREFEAESTAYLVANELGVMTEETAAVSRGYVQWWLDGEQPPEQSIPQVFRAADAILRAGRLALVESDA